MYLVFSHSESHIITNRHMFCIIIKGDTICTYPA